MYNKSIKYCYSIMFILMITVSAISPAFSASHKQFGDTNTPEGKCLQGTLLVLLGNSYQARPLLEEGFAGLQQVKNSDSSSTTLCGIYLMAVYVNANKLPQALSIYEQILTITPEDDLMIRWTTYYLQGAVMMRQGRYEDAYRAFEQTDYMFERSSFDKWYSSLMRQVAQAAISNNKGVVTISLALIKEESSGGAQNDSIVSYETGINHLEEAIDLLQDAQAGSPSTSLESILIDGLMSVMMSGSIEEMARIAIDASFSTIGETLYPFVISNLGAAYLHDQRLDQADEQFRFAYEELQKLRAKTDQSVMITDTVEQFIEATIFANQTLMYHNRGEYEQALASYQKALTILQKFEDAPRIATLHFYISRAYQGLGQTHEALVHLEKAKSTIETVRVVADNDIVHLARDGNLATNNLVGLQGMMVHFNDIYDGLAQLYQQQGQGPQAFQAAEQGRSRLFLQMIAANQPQLTWEEQQLFNEIQDIYTQIQLIEIDKSRQQGLPPEIESLLPLLDIILNSNESTDISSLRERYNDLLDHIRLSDSRIGELLPEQHRAIVGVKEVQESILDEHMTLVAYYVLEDQVLTWVIDQENFHSFELDISRRELNRTIGFLNESILVYKETNQTAIVQLHEALIKPLQPYIQNHNLVIIPHNELHYLPFAALWDQESQRYLAQEYAISYAPSASILKFVQGNRNDNQGRMLALAYPGYDNPLVWVDDEVDAIAEIYDTDPHINEDANESLLYRDEFPFDTVHLAAHGSYSNTKPLASHIKLASSPDYDGQLQAREIFSLNLSETNLVVLSACKTAMGENSKGDEIVGLTRSFLYAGTPAIVTTLWSIDDSATRVLMEAFYRYLDEGLTTAEALRAAQLLIMQEEGWRDPYYWAAFSLHGDYLGKGDPTKRTEDALDLDDIISASVESPSHDNERSVGTSTVISTTAETTSDNELPDIQFPTSCNGILLPFGLVIFAAAHQRKRKS